MAYRMYYGRHQRDGGFYYNPDAIVWWPVMAEFTFPDRAPLDALGLFLLRMPDVVAIRIEEVPASPVG